MDLKYTKNEKILFIISNYLQYQTYIQTQSLKDIKDRLVFLVYPQLKDVDLGVPSERIFYYSYPGKKNAFHRHIFNINSFIHRKKNKVFWLRTLTFKSRQRFAYQILSLPILSRIARYAFLRLAADKPLFDLIKKIDPAIILLPSHAFEGITFETIRIAKKIKIPSYMIIDNWDTVANKTIFTLIPDYLGVWSQQQAEQAVEIRSMPQSKIFILGTPRFTKYLKPGIDKQPSPYPFRYCLFVGTAQEFDELGALKRIDNIIDKLKLDLKVVYRPTATQRVRNCPDVFFEYDFKNVFIDTPTKIYYKKSTSWNFAKDTFNPLSQLNQEYFIGLLSNMEFMIATYSTMILESGILGKKTYLLAYDDGFHEFGAEWIFKNGQIFRGIDRLKNFKMIRNIEDMEKIFTSEDESSPSTEYLDIDYFVSKEATANYAVNLKKTIDTVLENWAKS